MMSEQRPKEPDSRNLRLVLRAFRNPWRFFLAALYRISQLVRFWCRRTLYSMLFVQMGKRVIFDGPTRIRGIVYFKNITIGDDCWFGDNVIILAGGGIKIGKRCSFNFNTYLDGQGQLEIGDNVIVAPYTKIVTSNHRYQDKILPIRNPYRYRFGGFISYKLQRL